MLSDRPAENPRQQGDGRSPSVVSPEVVNSHLEKILSSQTFLQSPQLSRFLRFVVEQAADGHGDQLKEYLVGVEVFRKDESYDPRIDTVVRTEARRLRHKLREYYQGEGQTDAIQIDLPKGSYCPVFRPRPEAGPGIAGRTRPSDRWPDQYPPDTARAGAADVWPG